MEISKLKENRIALLTLPIWRCADIQEYFGVGRKTAEALRDKCIKKYNGGLAEFKGCVKSEILIEMCTGHTRNDEIDILRKSVVVDMRNTLLKEIKESINEA